MTLRVGRVPSRCTGRVRRCRVVSRGVAGSAGGRGRIRARGSSAGAGGVGVGRGGAKGAYQAGVVRFLAEQGVQVVAVAGASIGALNGAVLAAARDLAAAAVALREVWWQAARDTGPPKAGVGVVWDEGIGDQVRNLPGRMSGPMLQPGYLDALLTKYVDPEALRRGLPLFVTTFRAVDPVVGSRRPLDYFRNQPWDGPVRGAGFRLGAMIDVLRSKAGRSSDWVYVNDMPPVRMHNVILGSAGIPFLMAPRNVNGVPVRDGDVLGRGNMPVGALAGRIPCERVVAVHLQDQPLFHGGAFPGSDVVQIHPSRSLRPSGPLGTASGSLDLSPARVEALYELGYDDAKDQLGRVWTEDAARQLAEAVAGFRHDAVAELDEPLRNPGPGSGSGPEGITDDPEI
ncbi:patatin-like phospholipase family protein [Catenulispora yoronensis]